MQKRLLATSAALFSIWVFAVSANVFQPALNRMAKEFSIDALLMTNAIPIQFTGFILATIVGGIVADYLGKKKVFLLACILTLAGASFCGLANGLVIVYIGCFLMGTGGGILESQSSALLSDLYPANRKLILNISQATYCVGAISGPLLMGYLLPKGHSWRIFFFMITGCALALFILYLVSSIPKRDHDDKINYDVILKLVKRASFYLPCIIIFLYVFIETGIVAFINPYLFKYCDAPENWAIYSISIFWGTMTIGRVLCAIIPESVTTAKVVCLLMVLTALSLIGQALVGPWQWKLVFFGVSGFFCAGTWPLIVEITAAANAKFSGTAVGITVAAGAFGCVFAPPVIRSFFAFLPAATVMSGLAIPLFVGAGLSLMLLKARSCD